MTKDEKIIWDIFRDLYANATPPADFDKLVENATVNVRGEKEVAFLDYSISQEKEEEIFKKHLKGKSKLRQRGIKYSVILGASPRTII